MARLPYLDKDDLKDDDKELLARNMNLHRILAHSPGAARSFGALAKYIRFESTLDSRLRELTILQVGWLAKSPYEWVHHVEISKNFGVTDDDIRALATETDGKDSGLPELDRLVLRVAREITNNGAASLEAFDALKMQMSSEHVVDLMVTITFYNAVVRFLASVGIDVEDSYQHYLETYPLPE